MGLHVDLEKVVKVQISLKGWGLRYIRRCWYAIDSHLGSLTMIRKIIYLALGAPGSGALSNYNACI